MFSVVILVLSALTCASLSFCVLVFLLLAAMVKVPLPDHTWFSLTVLAISISYEKLLVSYEGIGSVYVLCTRSRPRKGNAPCICRLTDCLGYTNL